MIFRLKGGAIFKQTEQKNSSVIFFEEKYLHKHMKVLLNKKLFEIRRVFVIRIGFKPMACCLEGSCSIQLSYRTIFSLIQLSYRTF